MVNLPNRCPQLAAFDQSPGGPTEKVPDTGLTPECSPATSVTYRPSPAPRTSESKSPEPGSTTRLLAPTEGGER